MRPPNGIVLSVVLLAACAGAEPKRSGTGAAASTHGKNAPAGYESPARWEVHPSPHSYVTATMRLADGSCIVADESGQRWVTWPSRSPPETNNVPLISDGDPDAEPVFADVAEAPRACSGEARAAVDRAPEPIVAIVRSFASYAFFGESGTVHEAPSPLGRFTRRAPPPEPLWRIRGAGRTALAITQTGRLLRWTADRGYEPVDLGFGLVVDVAISPGGHAVALSAPETVFTSDNGGKSFVRREGPSIGAREVFYPPGGPFVVNGLTAALVWDPRDPAALRRTAKRTSEPLFDVALTTGRAPNGAAISTGSAVIDGERYLEVSMGTASEWAIWKGNVTGPLRQFAPDVAGPDDRMVKIAASGQHVAVAIQRWDGHGTSLRLRQSKNGGVTFGDEIALDLRGSELGELAVSPDGAVLITGACLPSAEVDPQCSGAPLLFRGSSTPIAPSTGVLDGYPFSPAFSFDGRSAYFLVANDDDRALSLLVSHDGGLSFEMRDLKVEVDEVSLTFMPDAETKITASATGTLGMLVEHQARTWLTTDADGRHVQVADPPTKDPTYGGFGERVLAISRMPSEDLEGGAPVWESDDGGVTWQQTSGPGVLRGVYRRHGDIACGPAACVVGTDATRIGWGAAKVDVVPFDPPKRPDPKRELSTPIACDLRPRSSVTHVDHVHSEDVLPDEASAARGPTAWTLTTLDPKTGAVGLVTASMPSPADSESRITRKALLAAVPQGKAWAFLHRPQTEGEAIARVTLGPASQPRRPPDGSRVHNLEIAWENQEEGTSSRAVLPDAGTYDTVSLHDDEWPYDELYLDQLSVSPGGIFVHSSARDQQYFFVDRAGKISSFTFPGWPEEITSGESLIPGDPVRVDGKNVITAALGSSQNGPQIFLIARPPAGASPSPDDPWTPWAATLAASTSGAGGLLSQVDWIYDQGRLATWALHTAPSAGSASAWMTRILADGTLARPVPLPTPYDLPATPRPCSAAEHKDLARVRARGMFGADLAFPGTRRAVVLHNAPKPKEVRGEKGTASDMTFLTEGLILRGTPQSPCVDAYFARALDGELASVILLGDVQHGWYFHAAPSKDQKGTGDEAPTGFDIQPITCRFDPAAAVAITREPEKP